MHGGEAWSIACAIDRNRPRLGTALDDEAAGVLFPPGAAVWAGIAATALAAAMGDEQWGRILRQHDRLLRDAIRDADGRVVKHEGDGVFAVFDNPLSGVSAAVCIQERLEAHRGGRGFAPAVRIGLHSGPATERNGDYFGMAVNTAARVMSLAGGGEIVATDTLAEGGERRASASRTVELKGLSEPTNVVKIAWRTSPTSTA